jgi:hypothetical protein
MYTVCSDCLNTRWTVNCSDSGSRVCTRNCTANVIEDKASNVFKRAAVEWQRRKKQLREILKDEY